MRTYSVCTGHEGRPVSEPRPFRSEELDAAFTAAVAKCRVLTRADAAHFVEKGYVVVKAAFAKEIARLVCETAWRELKEKHGFEPHEAGAWSRASAGHGGMPGYVRTEGSGRRFQLRSSAPRAFQVQADAVGGVERLWGNGESLAWRDAAAANLRVHGAPPWAPPQPRQPGWHKDGWHFRHFLDSPEQGLLTVPIYSDILPESGGTFIATDSIGPVARLLAKCPAGLHPDGVQAGGYLVPGLIEQCTRFEELTGQAGDMVLVHPYMLHRVSVNPSDRPRFIANAALVLAKAMRFDRRPDEGHSLVELAVLRALDVPSFDFRSTGSVQAFTPSPFRGDDAAREQRWLLGIEMSDMSRRGIVTPAWGEDFGYQSNR